MLQDFAKDLKKLRESKNVSLKEIASITKINQSNFDRIESGDFTFQPQTYIRAFIKQYASAINEDPDELIKDYDNAKAGRYRSKTQAEETASPVIPAETVKEEKPEPKVEVFKQERGPSHNELKYGSFPYNYKDETKKTSGGSSVLKILGLSLLTILVLGGIYFLVNLLFFTNNGNVEVERQNFDEILQQNEKTLLGKKTPQEIQDSIRQADEQKRIQDSINAVSTGDTLTLYIVSSTKGTLSINIDSTNGGKPQIVNYTSNEYGQWKATKFFMFSCANTGSISARLNGNPLIFPEQSVNNIKITRSGIVR